MLAILLCACCPLASFAQNQRGENFTLPQTPVLPEAPSPLETLPTVEGEIELGRDGVLGPGILTDLTEGEVVASPEFPFGYNLRQNSTSWLVGNGDDFGMFSLESLPSLPQKHSWGIHSGLGFHFLGGPIQTDMPPRLFDFQIGWQNRKWLSESFGYDVSAVVGAFSDFEGSAREGVRYPSHAVGYFRWSPAADLVFGIDYLDRDDYHMLPVAGLILTPFENLRLEIVYPRPRAELRLSPTQSIYLAGELGGGTWAVERVTDVDDVATYRDLRMLFGIATRGKDGDVSAFELGWIFARDLSYRSGMGHMDLQDTLLIRSSHLY